MLGPARITLGIDARPIGAQLGLEGVAGAAIVFIDLALGGGEFGGKLLWRSLARRHGRRHDDGQCNEACDQLTPSHD